MSRVRDLELIQAFADVLREVRAVRGLTQEELAFEAGVDRTFVGLLETSKRQPSLSVVFALARALRMDPADLVRQVAKRSDASSRVVG